MQSASVPQENGTKWAEGKLPKTQSMMNHRSTQYRIITMYYAWIFICVHFLPSYICNLVCLSKYNIPVSSSVYLCVYIHLFISLQAVVKLISMLELILGAAAYSDLEVNLFVYQWFSHLFIYSINIYVCLIYLYHFSITI